MIQNISCLLTDVIRLTLATCDYRNCSDTCLNYLLYVGYNCSTIFNNEKYGELWNTLFDICEKDSSVLISK